MRASEALSGVYSDSLLASQEYTKDSLESSLQHTLRGTATEQESSPSIDKTMLLTTQEGKGNVYDAKVTDSVIPWENRLAQPDNTKDGAEADVDASIKDQDSNAGDAVNSDLNLQSVTESSDGGEEEMTTMVVNDVNVRWDQDDCNPCEIPTQSPTLAPLYPREDDNYEDHIPIVNDEYDSWDELKENLPSYTDEPTAAPTQGPYTTRPPKDTAAPEDTTAPPNDTLAPGDTDTPPKDTTAPLKDTTAPENPTTPPEDTTAPPADSEAPTDMTPSPKPPADTTAPPHDSTPKPSEPTPAPTKEEEPTPAPTRPSDEYPICPIGQQSIGVAGWDHDGCVISGNVCVANTIGDCPHGAHCAWLDTGVYGCKDGEGCSSNSHTIGVVGWDQDRCIASDNVCVDQVSDGDCPGGAYCALLDTGVYGCVASATPAPTRPYDWVPTDTTVTCPGGQQSIGVAGWDHDGCVNSGNVCVANSFGNCPNGAHCTWLNTGTFGCMDGEGCSSNELTIGVVGWDHDGCIVSNHVCVDQVSDGDCPGGAYCALLHYGVYGCVASSTPAPTAPYDTDTAVTCPDGQQIIGVAGWDHDVCITSNHVCVGQVSDGDCPSGTNCALLGNGAYGCVDSSTPAPSRPYDEDTTVICPGGQQSIGVSGWDRDGCVKPGNVCIAKTFGDCPTGAHCAWLNTNVYGCEDGERCSSNESTIRVVGWDHDVCIASDHVCAGQVSDGNCPGGAYCALLHYGVYGCVTSPTPAPTAPYDTDTAVTCPDGQQIIGVAGWDHDVCITSDHVCAGQVSDGDCPNGANCALLDNGAYGCRDSSTPAPTRPYDGVPAAGTTVTCPGGQQSIGVAGWDRDGCVNSGNICSASKYGGCPNGAHCTWFDTGVYGCKDGEGCSTNEHTISVVGWNHDVCIVSNHVCVERVSDGDCPRGTYCSLLNAGVYGCVAHSKKAANGVTKGSKTTGKTSGTTTAGTSTSGKTEITTTGGTSSTTTTTTGGTTTPSAGTSTAGTANANTGADGAITDSNPTDALSAGAIAGIVIACAVFVAVVVGAVLFRQKALARQHEENLFADLSDTGGGDYTAM
ncbi:hypothetical protein GN244_ATG11262 [Phytophthora infestans]|uniref:Uncharacterized protein n=1 Tax=Phytophthora infestans TaxID=4787 RepID=A0A833T068_PHYIN|nr:hypothetical protein GN244_ATG11262 [Phytophthora infestans]